MPKVIDLTYEIFDGMKVYPGDPKVTFDITYNIKRHGYKVTKMSFGTHTSTHIDAQSHMHENGKTISDYKINQFIGKASLIRKENDLVSNEVVVIKGKLFNDELVRKIISFKPKMVGFDINNNLEIKYEKELLKHNILTVGPLNLKNNLPNKFVFCAFPLKIRKGDGSPVRAIAIID